MTIHDSLCQLLSCLFHFAHLASTPTRRRGMLSTVRVTELSLFIPDDHTHTLCSPKNIENLKGIVVIEGFVKISRHKYAKK